MGKRLADAAVNIRNAVALADDLPFTVGKLLADESVQLFGVDLKLHIILNIYAAAEYIRDRQRVPLRIRLDRIIYIHFGQLVLDLAEVHFYLVSYYTQTETRLVAQTACTVRIISAKKPAYSLLCSEDIDTLPINEQLRVKRLKAGLTIEQAAQAIGVERRRVMNYELGKVKRMKPGVIARLLDLYKTE